MTKSNSHVSKHFVANASYALALEHNPVAATAPPNVDTEDGKQWHGLTALFNSMHLLLIIDKLYARPAAQFNFCPLCVCK